jgi:hypothetical protein
VELRLISLRLTDIHISIEISCNLFLVRILYRFSVFSESLSHARLFKSNFLLRDLEVEIVPG